MLAKAVVSADGRLHPSLVITCQRLKSSNVVSLAMIDIRGLDKAEVLLALYHAAFTPGSRAAEVAAQAPTVTIDHCRSHLAELGRLGGGSLYIDYFAGRVIKVDLSGDEIDPWLFDRDNGGDACKDAIEGLRSRRRSS